MVVHLRGDGSPASVHATQRLKISRIGDFAFVVPAPVLRVAAAPGSEAEPGQRKSGIVWQGFSSGRRVLGARAVLDPVAAARGLPLAVEVERRDGATSVRLIDTARRRVGVTRGFASAARLQPILRRVRTALTARDRVGLARTPQVEGSPTGAGTLLVALPLRVRGTIAAAGRPPVRVSTLLGKGRPLLRTVTLPGRATPQISLRVDALRPQELLPSTSELARARDPLRLMQVALARVALANQYAQYLASPDPFGVNQTSYVYRSVAAAPERAAAARDESGGSATLAVVLASVLGAGALVGLAVLWARS